MSQFQPQMIRLARERAGLSRELLAVRAGCSYSAIVQYERGDITPSVPRLAALADALGLAISDLFAPVPEPAL